MRNFLANLLLITVSFAFCVLAAEGAILKELRGATLQSIIDAYQAKLAAAAATAAN